MVKKILIGIPHNSPIDPEAQVSIFNLSLYLSSKGFDIDPRYSEGTYLSSQRNSLSFKAYKNEADLFCIDSDMVFQPQEADYLIESDKDIIGGLYFARRPPHFPVVLRLLSEEELKIASESTDGKVTVEDKEYFFKMGLKDFPQDKPFTNENGLGVGTGFLYIKHNVLERMWNNDFVRKMGKPFNYIQMNNGDEIKEDLAFAIRAKELGIDVWCDPRTNLYHLGKQKINKQIHIDFEYRNQLYGNDIEGWMSFNELNWLYHTVKNKNIGKIAEIGSWKGRSTHALLSATNESVYAIDHFKGSPDEIETTHKEAKEKDIYSIFADNVGKFKNLEVIEQASNAASKYFNDNYFDMVFIDGDHSYESVKQDIELWNPKVKRLICGHDFNFPSVNKAVTEYFGNSVKNYESIWFVWKD